jgi:predicted phosphodiesterase
MRVQRVAALYDIHGNLPALDAVLEDVRREGVDRVVIGGDVMPGPMAPQVLERLASLEIPVRCIRGNGDRVVLTLLDGGDVSREVPRAFIDPLRWCGDQLDTTQRAAVGRWPPTLSVAIDRLGDVLFCHATPRNDVDVFLRTTPDERLAAAFAGVTSPLVVCGHTHIPFDRMVGSTRVVNAGSVGMPYVQPRGAYWLLLGPRVELRRTDYDYEAAAAAIRASGCPMADETFVRCVLNPMTETEANEMLAPGELSQ